MGGWADQMCLIILVLEDSFVKDILVISDCELSELMFFLLCFFFFFLFVHIAESIEDARYANDLATIVVLKWLTEIRCKYVNRGASALVASSRKDGLKLTVVKNCELNK